MDKRTLSTLVDRLRDRMNHFGISGNELSRRAGLGTSYVNDILGGLSKNPDMQKLERIAKVADVDIGYLLGKQVAPRAAAERQEASTLAAQPDRRAVDVDHIPLFSPLAPWPDSDGFFGLPHDSDEGTGLPFDRVPGGYAVLVPDDHMAPRYVTGERVYANPRRPIVAGSYVVIRLTSGMAAIRRVAAVSAQALTVSRLSDGAEQTFSREEIEAVHRVTAASD